MGVTVLKTSFEEPIPKEIYGKQSAKEAERTIQATEHCSDCTGSGAYLKNRIFVISHQYGVFPNKKGKS